MNAVSTKGAGKRLRVNYGEERLELRALGECGVSTDEHMTVGDKSLICRDGGGRFFMVKVRQRFFSTKPLRVRVSRIAAHLGVIYAKNSSPVRNLQRGGF